MDFTDERIVPVNVANQIDQLKKSILQQPQYEPETEHYFHAGMYVRKVFRHAGVVIVGKVHKKEHFYIIAQGTVLVSDGVNQGIEYTAPAVICSKAGTKRAVYAVTDAVTMTCHITDSTTIEDAESELVEPEPDSPYTIGNKLKNEVLK